MFVLLAIFVVVWEWELFFAVVFVAVVFLLK